MPENISPSDALERLKAGNQRFVQNKLADRDFLTQVKNTANGQHPFAVIVGCIDSRAVPELIFDQGIGDLFSVRIAGNVIDEDVLASLEFSCALAGASLVVVKGHTHCGAVAGACSGVTEGHLGKLLSKINPAIEEAKKIQGENLADPAFRDEVSRLNALYSVEQIKQQSNILRDLSEQGKIKIVAALYDVTTGKVNFDL
ncbi:MAG: carbonic anhydrase [Chitinophagaceae bacterium]|nr:MAG: carbonic anhydrase [Chitinophagaceae bacterium]